MSSPSPPPRCAICLDDVYTPARPAFRTECDHAFHRPCILDLVLHDLSASGNHVLAEKFAGAGADDELHAASLTQHFRTTTCPLCRARIRIAYGVKMAMEVECLVFGGGSAAADSADSSPSSTTQQQATATAAAVKSTMHFETHHAFVSRQK
jgi:hypothetical protein